MAPNQLPSGAAGVHAAPAFDVNSLRGKSPQDAAAAIRAAFPAPAAATAGQAPAGAAAAPNVAGMAGAAWHVVAPVLRQVLATYGHQFLDQVLASLETAPA
jgi:hypothetical protein